MCGIFASPLTLAETQTTPSSRFENLHHRGPDCSRFVAIDSRFLFGFHRLSIMDLSEKGMQPFSASNSDALICNGEIYNYKSLKEELFTDYSFQSESDCEILLPLIQRLGLLEASKQLDAEFALIFYDAKQKVLMAARDHLGIRPLFYGKLKGGNGTLGNSASLAFASEAKALLELCDDIQQFPPGHIYDGSRFVPYRKAYDKDPQPTTGATRQSYAEGVRERLIEAVQKRLHPDAPLGFLLSGGLDSSLVCAIAARMSPKPIRTFSVGCSVDAIDIKYAEKVAKDLKADHTNVWFSHQDALDVLDKVIYHLESWDTTTVRASIGMFIVARYIHEKTDIKVLMTGEVSDELFGYKYTDYAPNAYEFQKEAIKRMTEIHFYDVLRADRCLAANALEARVPFGDQAFVEYAMQVPASFKMNTNGMGKSLLREAFAGMNILSHDILYREKAAFSDAVGHSVVDTIKAHAEKFYTNEEFQRKAKDYPHSPPQSKEALLYREIFQKHYAQKNPSRDQLIPAYWLPNQSWQGCEISDPSARYLPNYGKSGF
ncbi:MAG: asparagine synthase B [Oligoflexales bacterium]|nr:asparagine synthase B [Oligoflexales bacterium]